MYLNLLFFYSFFIFVLFSFFAKDALFFGRGFIKNKDGHIYPKTDQEKMLQGSKTYGYFYLPSRPHSSPGSRSQLREIWVFFSNFLALLFNRRDEFINIFLSLLSNFGSSVFLYIVLNRFFSNEASLFGAFLYATSLWPYQVAYFFGHIHLAQIFFLFTILLIDLANIEPVLNSFILIFISGFCLVLCFSSSSASRKYPPVIFVFFIFKFWEKLSFDFNLQKFYIYMLLVAVSGVLYWSQKSFFIRICDKKISNFQKNKKTKKKYLNKAIGYFDKLFIIIAPVIFLFIFIKSFIFLFFLIFFILGIFFGAFLILFPNVFYNLSRYIIFLDIGKWANHFKIYPKNFFKDKKIYESENFIAPRKWYLNFFIRFCPLIFLLSILSFLYITIYLNIGVYEKLFIVFFSSIPLLIIEFTRAMRVGKSYLPILLGFILLITFASNYLIIFSEDKKILFGIMTFICFVNAVHKFYFFFYDVLPSRLGSTNLAKFLIKKKIRKFATYNNPYNNSLLGPILEKYPNKFKITFVKSIKNNKNIRYFVIPPRSSKSFNMETESYAIKYGDFTKDKALSKLELNGHLSKMILAKFKSMGSSKFYVAESEITGYREFCLNEITSADRNLALSYVIDLKKV